MELILGVELGTKGYHFRGSMTVSSLPYRLAGRKIQWLNFLKLCFFDRKKLGGRNVAFVGVFCVFCGAAWW
jgi:hypothetical protein